MKNKELSFREERILRNAIAASKAIKEANKQQKIAEDAIKGIVTIIKGKA